jgi:hypothetical protein
VSVFASRFVHWASLQYLDVEVLALAALLGLVLLVNWGAVVGHGGCASDSGAVEGGGEIGSAEAAGGCQRRSSVVRRRNAAGGRGATFIWRGRRFDRRGVRMALSKRETSDIVQTRESLYYRWQNAKGGERRAEEVSGA